MASETACHVRKPYTSPCAAVSSLAELQFFPSWYVRKVQSASDHDIKMLYHTHDAVVMLALDNYIAHAKSYISHALLVYSAAVHHCNWSIASPPRAFAILSVVCIRKTKRRPMLMLNDV